MPYPGVFKPIKKGNFRVSPFQVNKQWSIDNASYSSSGYTLQQAVFRKGITPIGTTTLSTYGQNFGLAGTVQHISNFHGADNDPINTYDQSFQHVIWHSVNHKYYKFPYDPANNLGASNRNTIEKRLFLSASNFTIPYFKVGESIKPGSLKVTDTSNDFILNDDRKGNLRDSLITSQSFATASNLVGYWGFNDEFKKFKYASGYHSKDIVFESNAYEVDVKSQVVNTNFQPGIMTTGLDDIGARGYTGSELLTNGDFSNGFDSNWLTGSSAAFTASYAAFSINASNQLVISSSAIITGSGGGVVYATFSPNGTLMEAGKTYRLELKNFNYVSGTHDIEIKWGRSFNVNGGVDRPLINADDNGDYVHYFEAIQPSQDSITIHSSGSIRATIDEISLKEVKIPRSGMKAIFDGTGYVKTDAYKALNFDKDDNFAISFWYGGGQSQSIYTSDANSLITKRGVNDKLVLNKQTRKREVVEEDRTLTRYPFDLEVLNNNAGIENTGKIRFRRSDGVITYSSASATRCTGSFLVGQAPEYHIVAQKSGSYLELWIDGTREIQSLDPVPGEVLNYSKLMFGAMNRNLHNALSGSVDEVRIYNYGLNETAIKSLANNHFLSGSAYQTSVAGNVFYKSGQTVISSAMPKYHKALGEGGNDTDAKWSIDYKGTHTIYENEVLVEVPAGHSNVSMNPTALQRANTDRLKKEFTGSLTPYITTIGLYNNDAQLLAIGKLAQPIAKRSDVDMNFIVRWDY